MSDRFLVDDFTVFATFTFDAVINFVGVGNPAEAMAMGNLIFDITARFDGMVLDYLQTHPNCRYLFLSSGAAYGSSFDKPANRRTLASVSINELPASEWYSVAKLHAECRHRAHTDLSIIDIRVFNYFSHTQDMSARFLITDIIRAIRDKTVLKTSPEYTKRDFLNPSDFHQLIKVLLRSPAVTNTVVDCYSRAPIEKKELLDAMRENFGLHYEIIRDAIIINATGSKPNYYSLNTKASEFGYEPKLTSLDGIMFESKKVLRN